MSNDRALLERIKFSPLGRLATLPLRLRSSLPPWWRQTVLTGAWILRSREWTNFSTHYSDEGVLIMAAAVADYRPVTVASDKIKKKDGDLSIPVERTPDILGTIGPQKTHQFLCGFSMETKDLVENSSAKLAKKNLDMVVANNLKVAGAGFGVDTNVVTFITPDGTRELPLMSKADVADAILDEILKRRSL